MSLGKYAAQMIALLSAFALCWTLAEFGIYYHMELGAVPESTRLVVYIVLAASYFWTSQVCRNVVVVTTGLIICSLCTTGHASGGARSTDLRVENGQGARR